MAGEGNEPTGSGLREKLEEALSANATLASELGKYKASDLISAKGYKHVTIEDLSGVKLDELEAKASELEESKGKQATALLRSVLASKGLDGEQLDAAVAELTGDSDSGTAALDRIRAASRVHGEAPAKTQDKPLFGPDLIRAAVHAEHKK